MAVFNTIATAIKSVVDTVAGAPTTIIRKADVVMARDSLPLCVISLGGETDQEWSTTGNGTTDLGTIGKRYAVIIASYHHNAGNVSTDLSTNPDFFQAAKRALNTGILAGASTTWDTELEQNDAWENEAFRDAFEVSRFVLYVGSAEPRIS